MLLGEDIKAPFGLTCFDGVDYMARCAYKHIGGKLCHTAVIHSKSNAISVIAHEAVHAANFILDGMGMEGDFNNDEVQAYMVQHICEIVEIKTGIYGTD